MDINDPAELPCTAIVMLSHARIADLSSHFTTAGYREKGTGCNLPGIELF